jgi:hemoglobin
MVAPSRESSIYRQLGGRVVITAVVDDFYRRVLHDPALAPFFAGTDLERLRRHQEAFLTAALGGPTTYEGRPLRQAHAGRSIGAGHFAAVAGHLAAALRACGVPETLTEPVIARVAALRDDVIDA